MKISFFLITQAGLYLCNQYYADNNSIALEDIGDGDCDALLCYTNFTGC